MGNLRDIKGKIRGVKNIKQITQAMKLVATARLKQAVDRVNNARHYLEKVEHILADILPNLGSGPSHPFFTKRHRESVGIVVMAGERGLCGSFNHELLKTARRYIESLDVRTVKLITVGKKAGDGLKAQKHPVIAAYPNLASENSPTRMREAVGVGIEAFMKKEVDAVWVVYSRFISAIENDMIVRQLLPVSLEVRPTKHVQNFLYEPSPKAVFDMLLPLYIEGFFSLAVMETAAAEQGARMVAMGAATDKAEELLGDLTLKYNRTRQD